MDKIRSRKSWVSQIQTEGLVDMGFSRQKYTWTKGLPIGQVKVARLDKALCSLRWRNRFPKATVTHLLRISSDHTPILIRLRDDPINRGHPPFKFQAAWLTLKFLSEEELTWFERSREDWIVSGDRNTTYYYAAATIRKARNKIKCLRDDDGVWISDQGLLKDYVRVYYANLFSNDSGVSNNMNLEGVFPSLTSEDWDAFNTDISKEEVHGALSDMAPFKAPGPDGFHATFYQRMWSIVGESLF
ncbi:uncharacterized protein LOC116010852 [Ipomoea triloba]|uniref:uncharacterized protein LOC116010852 n=1 Tax=Ipomoea triloba TaxID=35885 RepID=UPI00125DC46C|nr:uncharacterized protein LOC116010852 [Ipomoea triloba]